MITGFLAAIVSAIFLSKKYVGLSGTTDHSIIGLVVLGVVLIHLTQRRQTIWRLLARLLGRSNAATRQLRLAISDTILWLLTLNAMISGFADFVLGRTRFLSIPTLYTAKVAGLAVAISINWRTNWVTLGESAP